MRPILLLLAMALVAGGCTVGDPTRSSAGANASGDQGMRDSEVHYWRLPAGDSTPPTFAYVAVADSTFSFGWRDRAPPGQ